MRSKSLYWGSFFLKKVLGKSGRTIGAVAYHLAPGGIMHVLQMLARPKTEPEVLDCFDRTCSAAGRDRH